MRTFLPASLSLLLSLFCFSANAQDGRTKPFPSDAHLRALVNKYVHTRVRKTVAANGDVFLQRDLSVYLTAKFFAAPDVPPSEKDYGHDHKDERLLRFLNRPQPSVATLNKYFDEAAKEFGVPAGILKAAGQVQSNWAQVSESLYGSWGVMGLVENKFSKQISKAASLLNITNEAIQGDARTNIRAAAALLKFYQKNANATKLEDWFNATQSLTGLWNNAMARSLALRIYEVLQTGSKTVSLWGEIVRLEGADVSLSRTITEAAPASQQRTQAVDYPLAVSAFTTCNYGSRPAGSPIKFYFVHYVATGTYQGAISWFQNCTSQVSAHYVVRNNDGEVSQVVAEADRAWSQGVTLYNDQGIGVEHEVLATNLSMWDSDPMLNSAAALCKNVCNRRAIPTVRRVTNGDAGIYGHSDVRATDCPNLTPQRWTNFLNRVNAVTVAAPTLYSVVNPGTGTQTNVTWKANIEPTLAGYRLYYATSDALNDWKLAANEATLTASTTSVSLDASQFIVPPNGNVYHFKLTAVATDGGNPLVEGPSSDVYSRSSNTSGPKVLIVDGFDRFGGTASYPNPTHSFATSYFKALRNNASLQISTAADEKVADGTVSLSPYNMVVWFSGDESGSPLVISTAEKTAIRNYLDGGGKLFISGSEIAYNISRSGSANRDSLFHANYLKSNYAADGSSTYTPATGLAGTGFEGLKIPFGFVYHEDFPDAINAVAGATNIMAYNGVANRAGVAYKGTFGSGTVAGGVVYLSFPLETAVDTNMTAFAGKMLAYFDVTVQTAPIAYDDAGTVPTRTAKRIGVLANDFTNGSPLNAATITIVSAPANGTATVEGNGAITYVSNIGYTGTDSYQYKVQNGSGQLSNAATVTLSVVANIACNPTAPEVDEASPKRDLRGAWVSTVFNLDWPSSRTLTTAQQQAELINVLDGLSQSGINAVFLQVRPEADALYASSIEPWSYWLTNAQGTAPNPLWDPLAFAVEAAHARGLELHAWINPFRAKQSTPTLATNHIVNQQPGWILDIPTTPASKILNPGLPAVRQYLTEVVADIATRYDVDGIHFDDYFYPSVITTQDDATYAANNPTGISTKADWRRNNSALMVAKVYDTLAAINAAANRNVVFGVSPFGIWKSGTPVGITGSSSFNDQFYDPVAWMQAGKVDYIAPQLYWIVGGPQDYNALSKWWNDQGLAANRYIYPGLALYRLADASNWAASEIEAQINLNRDALHEQVRGQILFRAKNLLDNVKGIKASLQANQFKYKALPPAMLWKDAVCPAAPVNVRRDGDTLRWDVPAPAADGDLPRRYAVYRFASAAEASTNLQDASKLYAVTYSTKAPLPAGVTNAYFLVTALDKNNNESETGAFVILPVTGLELTVKLSGNTVLVNWTTLTEINTKEFEVERSTDGQNFKRLGTVNAAGNSGAPRSYGFNDFVAEEGVYYYRIKTLDRDGRSSRSAVKSIAFRNRNGEILVGPNPFQTGINISNLLGVKRIEVVDMSGRIVMGRVLANQPSLRLEMPQLPSGLYQLRFTKSDGSQTHQKLVKQ